MVGWVQFLCDCVPCLYQRLGERSVNRLPDRPQHRTGRRTVNQQAKCAVGQSQLQLIQPVAIVRVQAASEYDRNVKRML